MSNVSDSLSGSSGSGDSTFSDASLGDQIMGGSGSFTDPTAASDAGGGGFGSFNDIANLLSGGGGSSIGAQAATMTPPSAAAATGGDPTGAGGGTQSATSPGSTPANSNQPQPQQNQPQQSEHAPPQAVDQLKTLLKALSGKPTGPTAQVPQPQPPAPFALPTLAAGQTGRQSPVLDPSARPDIVSQLTGSTPAGASLETGETGPQSPGAGPGFAGSQPGGARDIQTGRPSGPMGSGGGFDATTGQWAPPPPRPPNAPDLNVEGEPITAAGTPAADTPLPPPRPGDQTADAPSTTGGKPTPKTDDQGRQITVQKPSKQVLPTRVPHPDAKLPTKKPGREASEPSTFAQPPSRIIQDISGRSTGIPTELGQLAQAAMALAPLIGMFMGGGGRRGHFHGGRFTHGPGGGFRGFGGGMRAMGGRHPPMRGPWPYHHPVHGWDMHHMHPGGGWRPLSPMDAQGMGLLGGQDPNAPNQQDPNAPDPNRPPKETGATPGPASDTPSGAIPGVSGKQVDDYTRQVATKYMIDPDTASKILAQESSYGQARHPGDDGTSFGPFQLHFAKDGNAMGDQFYRDTGLDPRDPRTWKQQIDYAMMKASQEGWTPWTTSMKKLGLNQWSGITTDRRFAGRQPMSNQPPDKEIAIGPTTLPPSSQPMVAGP